jgi:hypothetical protein
MIGSVGCGDAGLRVLHGRWRSWLGRGLVTSRARSGLVMAADFPGRGLRRRCTQSQDHAKSRSVSVRRAKERRGMVVGEGMGDERWPLHRDCKISICDTSAFTWCLGLNADVSLSMILDGVSGCPPGAGAPGGPGTRKGFQRSTHASHATSQRATKRAIGVALLRTQAPKPLIVTDRHN